MTRGLGKYNGSKQYDELELPAGPMGIFVSGKTQNILARASPTGCLPNSQRRIRPRSLLRRGMAD
jgi:hypothetical protein